MKASMIAVAAIAALLCAGSAANANSVNGTDDYHPSVLQLPPDCQHGATTDEAGYCMRAEGARHLEDHQGALGARDQSQKDSGE